MKTWVLCAFLAVTTLISCSRKTNPSSSSGYNRNRNNETPMRPAPNNREREREREPEPVITDAPPSTPATAPAPVFNSPMIVIDEAGRVITPADKLPADLAARVDYKRISRSFTAEQRKNLIYRFKMVPPRVLFVPDNLSSKSAKGTYVVYKKKFWYWKKDDGLFHLDETYYQ